MPGTVRQVKRGTRSARYGYKAIKGGLCEKYRRCLVSEINTNDITTRRFIVHVPNRRYTEDDVLGMSALPRLKERPCGGPYDGLQVDEVTAKTFNLRLWHVTVTYVVAKNFKTKPRHENCDD